MPSHSNRQSADERVSSTGPAAARRAAKEAEKQGAIVGEQDALLPRDAAQLAKLWEADGHPATDCFGWPIDSSRRHVDPTRGRSL